MKKQPKYSWNEEKGIAFTTLYYKNRAFIAKAQCHPDDRDMMSKLTGQTIAEYRATLKYLRFIRDYELQPQLKSLRQLYYSMKHSKKFNPKSYEAIMLYRQIHHIEDDIKEIEFMITNTKNDLQCYLNTKEKDHIQLRNYLQKKQLADNN